MRPPTLKEAQTTKWRTTGLLRSGRFDIPAGAVVEIIGKHGGWAIRTDSCPHCGVRVHMTKVPFNCLERVTS